MKRRNFIKTVGFGLSFLALKNTVGLAQDKSQPNILYIMSDDHAMNAISSYGGMLGKVMPTPNIDRLAKEGIRLNNCMCTNSICTPSRATILTSQYSHVNKVYTLNDDLDPEKPNVAKVLQKAGYNTAIVGKWHLHTEPSGFDYYNVLPNQGEYFNPKMKEKGKPWKYRKEGGEVYKGYATDVITDVTLDWLDKKRDKSKPFFMMCHHKAPHGLWEYAPRHKDLFKDVEIPEPPTLFEDKSHRSEATREQGPDMWHLANRMHNGRKGKEWPTGKLDISNMKKREAIKAAYQKYLKDYLRCVKAIDENVGRLLDYLDKNNLKENTIVIYTSDQGMFLGEHAYYDKRWIYEESLKMPFLARYPREIKPGTTDDSICLNLDFAPTFLDYAGIKTPDFMQGNSFRPILRGIIPENWQKSMYYRYWLNTPQTPVPAHYGVRTKDYKLAFFYGKSLGMSGSKKEYQIKPGWELYDLKKDPQETKNVYNDPAYQEIIKKLKKELLALKKKYGDTDDKYPEMMKLREKYW